MFIMSRAFQLKGCPNSGFKGLRPDSLAQIEGEAHTKAICALRSHGTFGRYVRQSKSGVLSLNQEKIAEDSLLDGKFLISASNMKMKAEDIVMGYMRNTAR